MSGETDAELQVEVRFIIPRGKTEVSVTECLSLGYDRSREAGHGPVWVTEEEVLALQPSKTVSPVVISNKQPSLNVFFCRMCLSWIRSPGQLLITSQSLKVLSWVQGRHLFIYI